MKYFSPFVAYFCVDIFLFMTHYTCAQAPPRYTYYIKCFMSQHTSTIIKGMDTFCRRIKDEKRVYKKIMRTVALDTGTDPIVRLKDSELFGEIMSAFGAVLDIKKAKHDLASLYDVAIHRETGTLMIANKGATLFCLSPRSRTPHLVRHVGICLYVPCLGVEFVNVGLVGNVYDGPVVLRSESACSPSFLFGSQRCNCAHQWESVRELAAHFNAVIPPAIKEGYAFESWVQTQVERVEHRHVFPAPGTGFVLMHIDTQNGMGSGFSEGEFSFDLFSRASMRHRGEYSSEQIHKTTMIGGFEALGLRPDPRREHNHLGYQITFIVLDFLDVSKKIVYLTNNPLKMRQLEQHGYQLKRLPLLGEVNVAGAQEAHERGCDFEHVGIDEHPVSFAEDLARLTKEITKLTNG